MAKILVRRTIEVYGEVKKVRDQLNSSWLQPGDPYGTLGKLYMEETERVEFEVDEGYARKLEKDYEDRKREKQQ